MFLGRLSLRYKFLMLLAGVLVTATAAYLGIAVQLFNTDKRAYILDNNAALAEALGEEVATGIMSSLKTMRLAALAPSDDAVKTLLRDDDNFVALQVLKIGDDGKLTQTAADVNGPYLAGYELDHTYVEQLERQFPPALPLLEKDGLAFQNAVLGNGPPLLSAALAVRIEGQAKPSFIVTALLRQDRRLALFQRSATYTTFLIDGTGNILAHADPKRVSSRESLAADPGVQHVLTSAASSGAHEYVSADGTSIILAYKKLGVGGLAVLSEIASDKAFFASRKLVERSALLATFVLALAFIPSILFSRRLTAALHRLYVATLSIAKGQFDVEVEVRTEDEVGALSASFNRMVREINRLIRETADKARMEKEFETAQLVQDNFFPQESVSAGPFQVASYFKPASECGGDWWGSIRQDNTLILLIGDATGHGVPAALITAAAHSCATTLTRLAERLHGLPLTPAFIMDSLNAAIFHAGRGRVKMTFFVAALDLTTGDVRYANASHEPPLVCRNPGPDAEATREHLDSFVETADPCLGEDLATIYHDHAAVLGVGDILLMYTDGLVECRNAAKEEYGERRLTRSLLKTAAGGADEIKERLVSQALEFSGGQVREDDVTVVVVKRIAGTAANTLEERIAS